MSARGAAHAALRDGTRAAHERVDALFGRFDLSDRGDYRQFLTAHANALPTIEAALNAADVAQLVADWPKRRRAHLLAADLADLGVEPFEPAVISLAADEATLLGTLYVLEGSRMGGRLLARAVDPALPVRYLAAEQALAPWRQLLETLERALPDQASRDAAVRAAAAAFDLFERAGRSVLDKA